MCHWHGKEYNYNIAETLIYNYGCLLDENFKQVILEIVFSKTDYELEEDSSFFVTLPDRMRLPDSLPTLIAQNYSDFSIQNETCIIGFYLPCELN